MTRPDTASYSGAGGSLTFDAAEPDSRLLDAHTAAASTMNNLDPLQKLPIEIFQVGLEHLPVSDHWRLQQVSRTWTNYFLSSAAQQHLLLRWNHRSRDKQLVLNHPSADLARNDSIHSIKSLISGRPPSLANINDPDTRWRWSTEATPSFATAKHRGDWIAYRKGWGSTSDGGWWVEAHNLATGIKRSFDGFWPNSSSSYKHKFTLSTDLIAFTVSDNPRADNRQEDDHEFTVHTINLADSVQRKWTLSAAAYTYDQLQLHADRGCVVCIRRALEDDSIGIVEFFDTTNDTHWSFPWTSEPARRMYANDGQCTLSVNAERKMVTIWSCAVNEASPRALLDSYYAWPSPRIVAIERFDFDGKLLYSHEVVAMPRDKDMPSLSEWRRPRIAVSPADQGDMWTVCLTTRSAHGNTLSLQVDLSQDPPAIHALDWNHHFTLKVWRGITFHCDERGVLHTGRYHTSAHSTTIPSSQCFVEAHAEYHDEQYEGSNMPDVIGVNDRYLVLSVTNCLWIYSFLPITEHLRQYAAHDQHGEEQDAAEDRIVWRSTEGMFSADEEAGRISREIVHTNAGGILEAKMLREKPRYFRPWRERARYRADFQA